MVIKYDQMFEAMMDIVTSRHYYIDDKKIQLQLTTEEMKKALYFPEEKIYELMEDIELFAYEGKDAKCKIVVENIDTLEAAKRMCKEGERAPLVLNFANPARPGGGVRVGAKEQEEELCRRSTLLTSLESEEASAYYESHRGVKSIVSSDAVIISPNVEVFKDANYELLDRSYIVSVITCAAPMVSPYSHCLEDATIEDMRRLFYRRIAGMFAVARYLGFSKIVLGAWGCGAHNNNPGLVSEVFKKVLKDINAHRHFEEVCFAILTKNSRTNLETFERCFAEN